MYIEIDIQRGRMLEILPVCSKKGSERDIKSLPSMVLKAREKRYDSRKDSKSDSGRVCLMCSDSSFYSFGGGKGFSPR